MSEIFDRFLAEGPESKLELIDGQLIAGNSLAGSRYLLHEILTGWGLRAALPLAPRALWWEALAAAFQPTPRPRDPAEWEAWATHFEHEPQVTPVGPRFDADHHAAYQRLKLALYTQLERGQWGRCLGRDFVMRLGEAAFTPDLLVVGRERLAYLNPMYLDGPADLVIEVLLPGHEAADTELKHWAYARGGVPEYWVVNAAGQFIEFWRLTDGAYQPQGVEADGKYRPANLPGLACAPERLWDEEDLPALLDGLGVIEVEAPALLPLPTDAGEARDPLGWDSLPFEPRLELAPHPIGFNQFMAWCPEAKFEGSEGRWPIISGHLGTRNVLGMLLMTVGLTETARLRPPMAWLAALAADAQQQAHDADRRAAWWAVARRAAELLREQFGVKRLGLIGDLTRATPLNLWSEITLVVWDWPLEGEHDLWQALYHLSRDPAIDLIEFAGATPAQRVAIARELVEL